MPNIKDFTDALTALTAPVAGDLVYVRNAAGNRKMTVQNLLNGVNSLAIIKWRDGGDIGGYWTEGYEDYINIEDNANLDFGLNDFSLEMFLNLADYTPSAEKLLLEKHASNLGYKLLLTTAGKLKLQIGNGTNFTTFSYESDAIGVTDSTWTHIFVTANRDGNALFYVNGILNKTVDISGSVAQTLDNTGTFSIFGNGTIYTGGKLSLVRCYNLVIPESEILHNYNNNRPDLVRLNHNIDNGSQNNYYTSDFSSGVNSWLALGTLTASNVDTDADGAGLPPSDDWLKCVVGVSGSSIRRLEGTRQYLFGKYVKFGFTYFIPSDQSITHIKIGGAATSQPYLDTFAVTKGSPQVVLYPQSIYQGSYIPRIEFTGTGNAYIKTYFILPLGCVAEFLPQNTGKLGWIDSSGNQISATLQSNTKIINLTLLKRPPYYRDIRKSIAANTNTTLTDIVPRGYKIVSIRAKGSDSLADIKIGSASAGEQIVAATTTSSTTPKLLTLAATANNAYSELADVTLYARHDTSASGKTMDLIFHFEKVGN